MDVADDVGVNEKGECGCAIVIAIVYYMYRVVNGVDVEMQG
jgi:hypothetical protein